MGKAEIVERGASGRGFLRRKEDKKMKRLSAALIGLGVMAGSFPAYAQREVKDAVPSVVGMAAWGTTVALSTGGLLASMTEYTGLGVIAFGLIAGPILEARSEPGLRGLHRYNGQELAENSKWEVDPERPLWKRLRGYPTAQNVLGFRDAEMAARLLKADSKKWVKDSAFGFMRRR